MSPCGTVGKWQFLGVSVSLYAEQTRDGIYFLDLRQWAREVMHSALWAEWMSHGQVSISYLELLSLSPRCWRDAGLMPQKVLNGIRELVMMKQCKPAHLCLSASFPVSGPLSPFPLEWPSLNPSRPVILGFKVWVLGVLSNLNHLPTSP